MENAKNFGIETLKNHNRQLNDAVMFDIDDTLINYDQTPNNSIIELANISHYMGFKVIIITARPDFSENRAHTEDELKFHNIYYDLIIYTNHSNKSEIKQNLNSRFVLSVGDLWTDVTDSLHYIKLPSKNDIKSYIITV